VTDIATPSRFAVWWMKLRFRLGLIRWRCEDHPGERYRHDGCDGAAML
jgi:hypothetical protein